MYIQKNKEVAQIIIERKHNTKVKEDSHPIGSESKSKSRNKKEYHLLLKPQKNNLYCSQSPSKASTTNTKNTLLSYNSPSGKDNNAKTERKQHKGISNVVMKNNTAKISKKRYNSKELKNIYHNELFGIPRFSKGTKENKQELTKEKQQTDINKEYLQHIITIQSTFRMFYYHKHIFIDIQKQRKKEEACVQIMRPFINMKSNVFRMIRNFRPIIIDKVLGEKIKYIDWLLRTKCLVKKQKAFDLLKERSIMHKMKTKVQRFSNMVDKARNKNTILDGNEIIQNLRNNYKKKKLKESKDTIKTNKGLKQTKSTSNKKEKKKIIHEKEINIFIHCLIMTYLKCCYNKIHQKSKEVSLKKVLSITDRKKNHCLSKAMNIIKDNAKLLTLIMNNRASLIQHKFINAFPHIKKRRETLSLIKSYKVNEKLFQQSLILIQKWFISSLNERKEKNKEKLRELFISHFLYRTFKPFMRSFLLSYRMSRGNE